jgi:hypothetical protein
VHEARDANLRVLFILAHAGYLRNFESVLELLAARGHAVHLGLDRRPKMPTDGDMLAHLTREHASITSAGTPLRRLAKQDRAMMGAIALRRGLDYLHYLDNAFDDAPKLRARAAAKAPPLVRILATSVAAGPTARTWLRRAVAAIHRSAAPHPVVLSYLREHKPDVLVVTPLVEFGSPQLEYIRGARTLGIPVVYCVASWDNLTSKGLIHADPDLVVVWNEAQREEAVRLHGIAGARIAVTGANPYDHWFTWKPSTSRRDFCANAGLPDDRPFVLYLGSSEFIAPNEQLHIAEWLQRLRRSPPLADVGVVIRPHPANTLLSPEGGDDLAELLERDHMAVVWPPRGKNPTTVEARQGYFDSLYHAAAVVGVNTSALIESNIVGTPVFTLQLPEFRDTQDGTLHFSHLRRAIAGSATSHTGHFTQIAAAMRGEANEGQQQSFIEWFIRPFGLDEPATPRLVTSVEELVIRMGKHPYPSASGAHPLRPVVHLVGWAAALARRRRRSSALPSRSPKERLRILFAMHYPGYLRYYDSTLAELARRGHLVDVCFDRSHTQREGLEALRSLPDRVRILDDPVPKRRGPEAASVRALRRVANYVQYLHPDFADASYLRARTRLRLPASMGLLGRVDTLPRPLVRLLSRLLSLAEEALPVDPGPRKMLKTIKPNVVVVTPLVAGVSAQADLVQAARHAGIPSALAVASWDHLTTKGMVRVVPDSVFVWNEAQRSEAVEFHRIPANRIVVTGAQPFDKWFDRRPTISREAFLDELGLEAARRLILFVGSTASISTSDAEERFVRKWIGALRSSDYPDVARAAVLVRPHPYNSDLWRSADLSDLGENIALWPSHTANPVSEHDRSDYFNSLFHADAVVGVNTSAMIEAAIVGSPVLTITAGEFADTQGRTLHFRHLLPENGGFLRVAGTLDEHLRQLSGVLLNPDDVRSELARFVRDFVRPHGIDRAATGLLADAIERTSVFTPKEVRRHRLLAKAWETWWRHARKVKKEARRRTEAAAEQIGEERLGVGRD